MPCKGCVLVVDDDPDIRSALADRFEAVGCTVVSAVDGVHAIECLDGCPAPPCLVLVDINMPRLDGPGLARFMRAHPCHRDQAIVSMSAGADRLAPPLVECHQEKPFDFHAKLMPLVERFCRDPDWRAAFRC